MAEWIEYETICVTRADWESFATRFANSRHPDERSLYKYVHGEVLPRVVEAINEEESRLAMERAMTNRKRSSRIALRESEREERERIESEARAKIARERAEQAAAQEKAEREAAEYNAKHTRELRLREREERLREREERLRARRGSPMAIEHGENAENEKQEAQVSAYPPDHVSASAPAPAPAPPALPTNPPHFSSAVLPESLISRQSGLCYTTKQYASTYCETPGALVAASTCAASLCAASARDFSTENASNWIIPYPHSHCTLASFACM